jgi:predicted ArsR family transcriptional regulator
VVNSDWFYTGVVDAVENVDEQLSSVASLGDPLRRRLYRLVVGRGRPVGRDEASHAVGVSRSLAAYHLDRLVTEGLLETRFQRLGTRRGPGAGRPAKLYERSRRHFTVQLPPRNYELAARVLAQAVEESSDRRLSGRVGDLARQLGRELGVATTGNIGAEASATSAGRCFAAMSECGYEPVDSDGVIRFRNCPFDDLAREHRKLVCGMNLALVEGLLDAIGGSDLEAVLDPRPSECCVALRTAPR